METSGLRDELYGAVLMLGFFSVVISHFKTGPHLLQLLRRMLQRCFAVKLQKCFVETSAQR